MASKAAAPVTEKQSVNTKASTLGTARDANANSTVTSLPGLDATSRGALTARGTPGEIPLETPRGVTMQSIMRFLFPPTLEHPESTGRLELFARYGPVDDEGQLRGGIRGSHAHTNKEIKQMIEWSTREALFSLFTKPRSTVEVVVEMLLPIALTHHYTTGEVKKMLREVPSDAQGRMDFRVLQNLILDRQRQRLQALRDGMSDHKKAHRVPFQSKPAHHLNTVMRLKKHNDQEEALYKHKRLHGYATLVATMEDQNLSHHLLANVRLSRDRGIVGDQWDRYCSVRCAGKASHVQARNTPRTALIDDGVADQHAGCSSLLAASMHSRQRA